MRTQTDSAGSSSGSDSSAASAVMWSAPLAVLLLAVAAL